MPEAADVVEPSAPFQGEGRRALDRHPPVGHDTIGDRPALEAPGRTEIAGLSRLEPLDKTQVRIPVLLVVLALAIGTYLNTLAGDLVLDDTKVIVRNDLVHRGDVADIFSGTWRGSGGVLRDPHFSSRLNWVFGTE